MIVSLSRPDGDGRFGDGLMVGGRTVDSAPGGDRFRNAPSAGQDSRCDGANHGAAPRMRRTSHQKMRAHIPIVSRIDAVRNRKPGNTVAAAKNRTPLLYRSFPEVKSKKAGKWPARAKGQRGRGADGGNIGVWTSVHAERAEVRVVRSLIDGNAARFSRIGSSRVAPEGEPKPRRGGVE